MTDAGFPPGGDQATAAVLAAFDAFDECRLEIVGLIREIRAGDTGQARDLTPAVADLGRALGTLMMEYERISRYRSRHGADTHGAGLDLAAARAEIWRRLALIEAASGPEGVS